MAAGPGNWTDPYRAYNFKMEFNPGITEGHFTQCLGLEVSVESIPYREAGINQVVHQIPGRVEYGGLTLRYGLTDSRDMWNWFKSSVEGRVERRNASIIMLGPEGVNEVMRWNLVGSWLARWKASDLNAQSHEIAIETMTLVFDTLDRG